MRVKAVFITLAALVKMLPALASAEPAYCDPASFLSAEIHEEGVEGIVRLREFRIGKTIMAGMAIGLSEFQPMVRLAEKHGAAAADSYCTWYLNSGTTEAEQAFNHMYLDSPLQMTPEVAAATFLRLLENFFLDQGTIHSFLGCMEERGYLAMGCNGQSHRGPATFGMILSFSGCTPAHSEEIVNTLWGLNGVKPEVRMAIHQAGYDLGAKYPELRSRMQAVLGGGKAY